MKRPICFLVTDLGIGGVQRVITILARHLSTAGQRVQIWTCAAEGALEKLLPEGVEVIRLKKSNYVSARLPYLALRKRGLEQLFTYFFSRRKSASPTLAYLPGVIEAIREQKPATVFTGDFFLGIEVALADRITGGDQRIVQSVRTFVSAGKEKKTDRLRLWKGLKHFSYMRAAEVTSVSLAAADDISASFDVPRERIRVIHNPTITPDFAERRSAPIDDPWLPSRDTPTLIAVGRPAPQKDYQTLLEALAIARRTRPLRLCIVGGTGDPRRDKRRIGRLQKRAEGLGVGSDVRFLGALSNPLPYIASADLLVLSSLWEGLPNVLLEALACETPIVSTDCPSGPFEILEGGTYGALVPIADPEALAKAILEMLDSPSDPALLRKRAADYDYQDSIDQYLEVLLGRPRDGFVA